MREGLRGLRVQVVWSCEGVGGEGLHGALTALHRKTLNPRPP